ncbi:MAG: anthranilate phosphoribosyltransferase [Candidatus Omnitrophica bacterium]|nr:anthranilate phosphoribosyltransferase [Candidatus Omnitrophota bacterium]
MKSLIPVNSLVHEALLKVMGGKDLSPQEMMKAFEQIMRGSAGDVEIGAFLTALRIKGETVEEITAAARVLRQFVKGVPRLEGDRPIVDTCGTGADFSNTFNISTVSAFVASGAGALVAKHGNRSVSSRCGSADLLEKLGIDIEEVGRRAKECLQHSGIVFLFAPYFHESMRVVAPVRRALGIPTLFNLLGPLSNPLFARHQLVGVYDGSLTLTFAKVLKMLGSRHVLVVHGRDGLDEVTTTTKTQISELRNGRIRTFQIDPKQFKLSRAKPSDLKGENPDVNAQVAQEILSGKKGPKRDVVVLNAACALYAADVVKTISKGIERAIDAIDSGKAMEKLTLLRSLSHREMPDVHA